MKTYRVFGLFLLGLCEVAVAGAQEAAREAIPNWSAPPFWSPPSETGARDPGERTAAIQPVRSLATAPSALPFIPITPCRVADTRGNGFTGAYGPPSIGANATRNFVISGKCGILSSAAAVSFNFAALNASGAGDLRVFPAGSSAPLVSTMNYNASTPNIANAAVVPLGTGGAITVQADATTIDLIIDVNGYYGNPSAEFTNVFLGPLAGNSFMTGSSNVGIGWSALQVVTSGSGNTAAGNQALWSNSMGSANTAIGNGALLFNQVGIENTAVGQDALFASTNGNLNVAIGKYALLNVNSSDDNIAIGSQAAANLTSGSHNIHIGNPALSSESNTIRIGTGGTHTKFFLAGVRSVTTGQANAVPVVIDSLAQLGTVSSSARVKREIADIGEESSTLLKLRPVSFFYRNDTVGYRQYGLIAEEVAAVMPDLVHYSDAGEPEMIRWQFLPPLLLNELQKQQKTIEGQQGTISRQNAVIAGLEARLARLEGRLPAESGP